MEIFLANDTGAFWQILVANVSKKKNYKLKVKGSSIIRQPV